MQVVKKPEALKSFSSSPFLGLGDEKELEKLQLEAKALSWIWPYEGLEFAKQQQFL